MARSARQRLMARPACPAPITTVVTLRRRVVPSCALDAAMRWGFALFFRRGGSCARPALRACRQAGGHRGAKPPKTRLYENLFVLNRGVNYRTSTVTFVGLVMMS